MANVVGTPGEVHTEQRTFSTVTLEAEHVTERHDPDPGNKDVGMIELPGVVNLYAVIDGGRVLIDRLRAPQVFEAIDQAKSRQDEQQTSQADQQAQSPDQQTAQPSASRTTQTSRKG